MKNILDIHEEVYSYLSKRYEKDNNFRFTLRQINRANRLEEGYWFIGNQNYLAFSFWTGTDWQNKTSNIIFVIASDGKSWLEFVSHEVEKQLFFAKVADALEMQQKKVVNDESQFRWVKDYKGMDYMASLDTFLKRDKNIIDAFIVSNEMGKVFSSIPLDSFQRAKSKIESLRKDGKTNIKTHDNAIIESKPIKIEKLVIKNIKLYKEEQTIIFHKNLTCFIGLNGTGKTSILQALVLAFTGYEQNETLDADKMTQLREELQKFLHVVGEKNGKPLYANDGFTEVTYSMQMNGNGSDDFKNRVLLRNVNEEVVISDDSNSDFRSITDDRYQCLFIGIGQLHGVMKPSNGKKERTLFPNVSDAKSMLDGLPENLFGLFSDWLRGLNSLANDKQAKGDPNPTERVLLNDIFKVMTKITGEEVTLYKIFVTGKADEPDPIWVNIGNSNEPILLELVSQGYNSVFRFIGNILQRLFEVTPQGADYTKTPAIVLIDEIDTYLHPQWQYTVLDYLVEAFPNVQFIVTTHSPYVVGSIPYDKIKIYICKKEGFTAIVEPFEPTNEDGTIERRRNVYGSKLEILNDIVFGSTARIAEVANLVSAMRTALQNNYFDEIDTIKEKLIVKGVDIQDPEISSLISMANSKKRMANKS